jgi:SpoU rRNA methylase family enzyme
LTLVIVASPHRDDKMRPVAKVRTTLTIDEDVLKWVKIRAARSGVSDSAVIEESLRRDLKLDVLDELWANATMSEAKASELAVEAQHATRPRRRSSGARGR